MRLIDADALMKEFAEYVRASNNSDFVRCPTWNDAVSLLGSAPTVDPERKTGRWIPCGEREPGICENCLVTVLDNEKGTQFVDIDMWCSFGWDDYNKDRWKVLAWMPLPKAYKIGADMRGEEHG